MRTRTVLAGSLAASALGALALTLACGGGGGAASGSTMMPTAPVNVVVTDAPADEWAHVWVKVTKVTLMKAGGGTEVIAFDAATAGNSNAGKVDLVHLDSVGELLASAQIPEGTYTRAKVSISTDPAHVTLIAQGGGPVAVSRVVGTDVPVDLAPALVVANGHGSTVQIDFDLSHPLFVVMLQDGTAVLNLQARHKPNPMDIRGLQFRWHAGKVASAGSSGFTLQTQHGASLPIAADGSTWFRNIDTHATGSLGEMASLATGGNLYALAFTRMDAPGSLSAARVLYSTDAAALAKLMAFMREGHVLAVNTGASTFTVNDPGSGAPQTIAVDGDTAFTFQGEATAVGTGAAGLAKLQRGFKVHVRVKDPTATPVHAASVNIQRAHDEGFISTSDGSSFTFGTTNPRTYGYAAGFAWWNLGQPMATSTDLSAWVGVTGQASQGIAAKAAAGLTWNGTATRWDAKEGILLPYHLPLATLASTYDGGTGTFQATYTDPVTTSSTTKTVAVTTGIGGTLLMKAVNQSGVITLQAATPADLTAGAKAWIRVVPQAGSLKAYSVVIVP